MKTTTLISALACYCTAVNSYAQGTLQITFDGPLAQPPGSDYAVTNYDETGMSFRPIPPSYSFGRVFPSYPGDPQDGTAYLRTAFGDALMFSFTNGSLFGLLSVDLAEYSTAFSNEPVTVPFIGYQQGGSTVTNIFTTDGIIDGTGPLADFQTFYFTNFTDLTRVEIPRPTSLPWSLDNLVVSTPEPAVGGLLLLGALALGSLRFRNRRR